jgi:hypothetical protein
MYFPPKSTVFPRIFAIDFKHSISDATHFIHSGEDSRFPSSFVEISTNFSLKKNIKNSSNFHSTSKLFHKTQRNLCNSTFHQMPPAQLFNFPPQNQLSPDNFSNKLSASFSKLSPRQSCKIDGNLKEYRRK